MDSRTEAPPPTLIESQDALERAAADWSRRGAVAIDTEADAFFAYREKICLLQVSTDDVDYIVDPLAPIDLRMLAGLFASSEIRKIFHDAEFDVSLLKAAGIREIRGVFDTRLGVALLGSKTPGLSNVLKDRYGIALDKSQQRSDWRRRPLTDEQLEYARHDTRHLLRLARDVDREISQRGLVEIFSFECARLESTEPRDRTFDPEECLGYRGARDLDPQGLSALRELTIERDRVARERDAAPFRVIPHEMLVLLARLQPDSMQELRRIRALTPRLASMFGAEAVRAIERARAAGPWRPEARAPRLSDEEVDLYERLRKWRARKSEAIALDSSAVLNRRTLEAMVKIKPQTREALATVPGIAPWQVERFADELLSVVRGK